MLDKDPLGPRLLECRSLWQVLVCELPMGRTTHEKVNAQPSGAGLGCFKLFQSVFQIYPPMTMT